MFDNSENELDNMVYIKAIASNKSSDSINNPFAIKTLNDESDFKIGVEVLPSNIYMNLTDIESEPIEDSDVKIYQEKINKKEDFKHISNLNQFNINVNKYDYSLDKQDIINDINKDLKNKIVILKSGLLVFNVRLNDNLEIETVIIGGEII